MCSVNLTLSLFEDSLVVIFYRTFGYLRLFDNWQNIEKLSIPFAYVLINNML